MAIQRSLYRTETHPVVAGVAGGVADYFRISPAVVRVLFVGATLFGGMGLLLYILLWIMAPKEPMITITETRLNDDEPGRRGIFGDMFKGSLMALPFALVLSAITGEFAMFPFIIGLGIGLVSLWKSSETREKFIGDRLGLYRLGSGKKIFGVFAGLSQKLGMDATILRVIGVALVLVGGGVMIPLYLLYAWIVPKRDRGEITTVEHILIG